MKRTIQTFIGVIVATGGALACWAPIPLVKLVDETPIIVVGKVDRIDPGMPSTNLNDKHSIFFRGSQYDADVFGFGFVDPELLGDFSGTTTRIFYPFQEFERFFRRISFQIELLENSIR